MSLSNMATAFTKPSAQEDIPDPIYANKDPIAISVAERKSQSGGSVLNRSIAKGYKQEFYFTMKLNGPGAPENEAKQQKSNRKVIDKMGNIHTLTKS